MIPGEPHVSGTVPLVRNAPTRADGDQTPPVNVPIRGRPARRHQQRLGPSMIAIGGLVGVAAVVALVLYIGLDRGEPTEQVRRSTPSSCPAARSPPPPTAVATTVPPAGPDGGASPVTIPAGDVRIVEMRAWDPDGDNGTENDTQAGLAFADGSASTAWPTECYGNQYLSGKRGVGLILTLSGPPPAPSASRR